MIENNQQQKRNFYLEYQSNIEITLYQNNYVKIMEFNERSSILVLGKTDGRFLKFQFKFGALKFIQELYGSKTKSLHILLTKKSNQIIIVTKKILFFSLIDNNRGYFLQYIDGPQPNCLLINKNDSLLIAGSNDRAIRFWIKSQNQWIFHQKFQICYYGVIISLSLNESENYLICLSELENKIFICKKNHLTNTWFLYQILHSRESQALQLCFIKDSIFILQLLKGENFNFYNLNLENQYFEQITPEIQDQQCNKLKFPHRFNLQMIKQRQFLIYKKDNCINLLLIQSEKSFEFQKIMTLSDSSFIFRSTEDGKYIVIAQENQKFLTVSRLSEG
ncbi:unnamed protein product [Paramecium sonneborni]|uniref:Uncharacterized protein n=1 Tax=Paramecium sonneborni TaxID=65129 RepID=A0A8S1NUF8_9CILI|nr:unnamed protein product [Paramecium sonneborni]